MLEHNYTSTARVEPILTIKYRVFLHDVTAAILVSQTSPVGVELFLMQTLSFVPTERFSYDLEKRFR